MQLQRIKMYKIHDEYLQITAPLSNSISFKLNHTWNPDIYYCLFSMSCSSILYLSFNVACTHLTQTWINFYDRSYSPLKIHCINDFLFTDRCCTLEEYAIKVLILSLNLSFVSNIDSYQLLINEYCYSSCGHFNVTLIFTLISIKNVS